MLKIAAVRSRRVFLEPAYIARRFRELAESELRFGRPIVFRSDRSFAALALDSASAAGYARFAEVTNGTTLGTTVLGGDNRNYLMTKTWRARHMLYLAKIASALATK